MQFYESKKINQLFIKRFGKHYNRVSRNCIFHQKVHICLAFKFIVYIINAHLFKYQFYEKSLVFYRSRTGFYRLPRGHCTDACCPALGYTVLYHDDDAGVQF